jgi:hypothetical protein
MIYFPQTLTSLCGFWHIGRYKNENEVKRAREKVSEAIVGVEQLALAALSWAAASSVTQTLHTYKYAPLITWVALRQLSGLTSNIAIGTYNMYRGLELLRYLHSKEPFPWSKAVMPLGDIVLGYAMACYPFPHGSFDLIDQKNRLMLQIADWAASKLIAKN